MFRKNLRCVLGLLVAATLPVPGQTHDITIDASALSTATISIVGVEQHATSSPFTLSLATGTYRIVYGGPNSIGEVTFAVTAAGGVDYDPSLDAVLSGRGSPSLVVNGTSIQIDASALTAATVSLESLWTTFPTASRSR